MVVALVLSFGPVLGETDLGFGRAIYGPWNYSQDARVGLDADYDNTWWTFGSERTLERFRRNSLDAAANNITYVAGLYYLGDVAPFDYVRAVNRFGEEQTHTPSTVDRTYWLKLVEEPAVAVANLSLQYPIWGLVWDFELYLASDGWETDYYSFDAQALEAFANATGEFIPSLPPEQRYVWLQGHGLLNTFMEWQERTVYEMAKSTEEKAHAINPNLSLGILGFSDSWRYWTTLEAFSTAQAPVTVWTEDTYGGYSEKRIDHLRDLLSRHGLNGKVVPGLYTVALNPWRMIQDMERAIRHNGVFWIYQHDGDQYCLADEWTYSRAYEIFDRYIFFNGSTAHPLPSFGLHPGVEARPYRGPHGVSLLLRAKLGVVFPDDVILLTDSQGLDYIGENLTVKSLGNPNLSFSDLPCIIYGLDESDLLATEVWSMVREVSSLLDSYNELGFERMEALESALQLSLSDFDAGRYGEIKSRLGPIVDGTYEEILQAIWPTVEEAMKSPRTSPIPLSSIGRISSAKRMYEMGQAVEGNSYLIAGLKEWALAVGEADLLILLMASMMVTLLVNRSGSRSRQVDTGESGVMD